MARNKVKLGFIVNDGRRKAAYKKRKKGLLNKVRELSTLCGVNVCAVIYSTYNPVPEVWPSILGVQQVISQFNRLPEMEKNKKMSNQESYLRERIVKLKEQLNKQCLQNREKELNELMFKCLLTGKRELLNLTIADLDVLERKTEQKIKEINTGIEAMSKEAAPERVGPQSPPQPTPRGSVAGLMTP